jgi:putative ABC transport system permease protein
MESLIQDLRYAVRSSLKRPAFSIIVVLALAIGIGVNTAIFSIVNSILLRPLAYGEPERLVMVWMDNDRMKMHEDIHSYPNYVDFRDQNQTFDHLATYYGVSWNLTGSGEPERIIGARSSANLFDVLKVDPIMGQTYTAEDEQPGRDTVVVLSYALWQRRFGGDPNIVGQGVSFSDTTRTIIGVMPPGFKFPHKDAEFWAPMTVDPQNMGGRGSFGYWVIGRLKPGVTVEQAQADVGSIMTELVRQYPNALDGLGINVVALHKQVVGNVRPVLLVLLGAVGFVLLIACANVANLLLARAASREREIAVRTALGAGRGRLIRQLLTESLVLAVAGGALGLLLAYWGVKSLIAISPRDIPRLDEIGIDWRVLLFTLGISLATGVVFGLAPAMQTSKTELNEALKEGGRTSTAVRGKWLRGGLVVAEIALSLVLLIGAGLMIKSFAVMQKVDMGFNPTNLVTMNLQLSRTRYQGRQGAEFYRKVIERTESLPGVVAGGATTAIFISSLPNSAGFSIEGRPPFNPNEQLEAPIDFVTPGYFRAMGVPLIKGRELTEQDDTTTPRVVLINQTFAEQFWPDEDPIGKRMTFGTPGPDTQWLTIVGVVGDMRRTGYESPVRLETFLPYTQRNFIGFLTIVVRTEADPRAMMGTLREVVREIDPNQPVSHMMTMDEQLGEMTARRRLNMVLMGILAGVALVLAAVGVYGVMSYSVAQRTHEFGLRVALGARRSQVFGLVLRSGLTLATGGVALGLGGAYLLTRFVLKPVIASLIYQISDTDLTIYLAVPAVMALIAIVACLMPARRATSVDPMTALRYE